MVHDDSFRRLLRARDAIHARYAEPLDLRALAREAALSPFHFLRLFRAAFGVTPHQYLTRVRLEAARRLLLADAPVTHVCFEVGFQSLGSFSALFARKTGMAPTAFRRRIHHFSFGPQRLYIPHCYVQAFSQF
ncbi:MAG TPA: AraC family transcriptional regulator [Myxococcales bacterium]|jgi:AraC-like DNA-binding protein|nr:AraC family transcriptional regulator [Myxococcales bacterium]